MRQPGPLLASGRDADIFEYGPGLVLRRSRRDRSMAGEARVMEHVRALGYPVPAVEEVSADGLSLVMERIDGVSMVEVLGRKPWTVRRQGRVLADLHQRLHEIPAPAWLPAAPCGTGDRVIHLDLHPLNVMLTAGGPMVIDWTGASRGSAEVDVALTWVLMAAGGIPGGRVKAILLGWGRGLLINSFLRSFDRDALRRVLPDVVTWKAQDRNMSSDEVANMRRLAAAADRSGPS